MSSPQLERDHRLIWFAMITRTAKSWRGDVRVTDLAAAGLPVRCVVRPAKIACVSVLRIQRKLGALRATDWKSVRTRLTRYRA